MLERAKSQGRLTKSQSQTLSFLAKKKEALSSDLYKEQGEEQVREKRYAGIHDASFLHEQQQGKLVGFETAQNQKAKFWATQGLREPNVVKKWVSDGTDFSFPAKKEEKESFSGWERMKSNSLQLQNYTMSLKPDPNDRRRNRIPGAIIGSKLRYLYMETFRDLFSGHKVFTISWFWLIGIWILALWFRVYVHYWAQYFYLEAIPTPIYEIDYNAYEVILKYMGDSIKDEEEAFVVAVGPLFVFVTFLFLQCSSICTVFFCRITTHGPFLNLHRPLGFAQSLIHC